MDMKGKIILIVIIVALLGGVFYWFGIRPSITYSFCHKKSLKGAQEDYWNKAYFPGYFDKDTYEFYYKECLREKGFNK